MTDDQLMSYATQFCQELPFPGVKAKHIGSLLAQGLPVHLLPGEAITEVDKPGDLCFFLISGAVRVEQPDAKGQLRTLYELPAPAMVGHMALIDSTVAAATCTAVDKAIAMVFQRDLFYRLRGENSRVGSTLRRLLLSSLSNALTDSHLRLQELAAGLATPENRKGPSAQELDRMAGFIDGWNNGSAQDLREMRVVAHGGSVRKGGR